MFMVEMLGEVLGVRGDSGGEQRHFGRGAQNMGWKAHATEKNHSRLGVSAGVPVLVARSRSASTGVRWVAGSS